MSPRKPAKSAVQEISPSQTEPPAPITGACSFLPQERTLAALQAASAHCRGCPLFERATQTVFGAGPPQARLMLVGEQPGNDEDLQGHPFIGPAGRLMDGALEKAGIDRSQAYITNVVKHFKWEPRGKRRIHQKPNAAEIGACRPWLEAEIEVVRPTVLVCLGATAAQALLGRAFRVSVQRGQFIPSTLAPFVTATVHPSSILRTENEADRQRELEHFTSDLAMVAEQMRQL